MSHFTALFDACVFYSAPLRDLLMHLALTDLFRAKWTSRIHDEWVNALLANRPDLSPENLAQTRYLMDEHVRDCLVAGYEDLIPSIQLPDENDRHVLAAAIRCRADVIVTINLRDFPAATLATYDIDVQHPDEFVAHLIDLDEAAVCRAAKRQRANLKRPAKTVDEFLDSLARQGLPQTVAALRRFADFI